MRRNDFYTVHLLQPKRLELKIERGSQATAVFPDSFGIVPHVSRQIEARVRPNADAAPTKSGDGADAGWSGPVGSKETQAEVMR